MYSKAWYLANLLAFGFCYGTIQLMSPTTFWTGSLVLMGLFVYDVVMMFYTPMMISVATKIDAPIKLVFPGPGRGSFLGLGDVFLPGIMIAIALLFDLYLHYLRKQSRSPNSKEVYRTMGRAFLDFRK
jgi:minor histocompatibility antigen H13